MPDRSIASIMHSTVISCMGRAVNTAVAISSISIYMATRIDKAPPIAIVAMASTSTVVLAGAVFPLLWVSWH